MNVRNLKRKSHAIDAARLDISLAIVLTQLATLDKVDTVVVAVASGEAVVGTLEEEVVAEVEAEVEEDKNATNVVK